MQKKYSSVGLDIDQINDKYPNNAEYEEIVNTYLDDEFFKQLKDYLDDEDYALAKDATKGLVILAQELLLYPLYIALMEIYEDLEDEDYKEVMTHYEEMIKVYNKIRGAFCA